MKICYYTSGVTGSGRVVTGISVGNAFRRKGAACEYTILHSSRFGFLAGDIPQKEIPIENESILSRQNYASSALYAALMEIKPDVLLVDLLWFPLYHFIHELTCKKILLCRQVHDRFFSIPLPDGPISFRPGDFDMVLATEPFTSSVKMDSINPIVIRNRDEILPKEKAMGKLGLDDGRTTCLFSYNGHPGDFERVKKKYSYLDDLHQVVYSTNYKDGGLFPVVDYFNAFDLVVCGAGYNQFWEIIYFDKEAVLEPTSAVFVDGERRVRECQEYYFDENGADQLADIIMKM